MEKTSDIVWHRSAKRLVDLSVQGVGIVTPISSFGPSKSMDFSILLYHQGDSCGLLSLSNEGITGEVIRAYPSQGSDDGGFARISRTYDCRDPIREVKDGMSVGLEILEDELLDLHSRRRPQILSMVE